MVLLEAQFQNAILAQYSNAERELATFALATSSFQLVNALVAFVPQMVTVMARSPADRATCLRFINALGLLLTMPLVCMGFLPQGQSLLAWLLNIPSLLQPEVLRYLQWLAPLVWINAIRQYCTGMLVLGERTRVVTALNILHLATLVTVLLVGRQAGMAAMPTLAISTISANILHLILAILAVRTISIIYRPERHPPVTYGILWRFFWPLAATSALFAMSRPVLYAFINLTPNAIVSVAALRVAFGVGMIFQNAVNQFRHVYATFGEQDSRGVARFMARVTAWLLAVMAAIVFTPLSRLLFENLMGLQGAVLSSSLQATRVLCLSPLVIAVRNLYHGQMMVERKTGSMPLAALLRVLSMGGAAYLLMRLDRLDHVSGALVLVLGFVVEAVMVRSSAGRLRSSA